MKNIRPVSPLLLLLTLGACAVGPDYVRPALDVPAAFKQAGNWQELDAAEKSKAAEAINADNWWLVLNDPVLNSLQDKLKLDNQNIRIAEAQYRAARAASDAASAAYYPTIGASLGESRTSNAVSSTNSGSTITGNRPLTTTYTLAASASWELDVWGRIRRSNESATAKLDASAADLAAARLSAQALLAQTYVQLRSAEAQRELQDRTVVAYTRYLELTRNRNEAGMASPLDVSNAESQLASARATGFTIELLRAQYEHALATLIGSLPSELALAPTATLPAQPATPSLIPSLWLSVRPDIVAAERRVVAANAQIGVAKAAWFPALTLTGSAGYRNDELSNLISLPHRFWSLGPTLAMTLFDGGARSAAIATAGAAYDQSVATYRQTVLTSFQEVEDNLAAARLVGEEKAERAIAAKSARRSREIASNQYLAGTGGQLEVTSAQGNELSAERLLIEVSQRHLLAAIQLYKNLGGRPAPAPAPVIEQAAPPGDKAP